MLNALRRKKNTPIILGVLGLVLLVMAFFGVNPSGLGQTQSFAAVVNGREIPERQFIAEYAGAFRQRKDRDSEYDSRKAKSDRLRENTLERLISQALLADAAAQLGLAVSDSLLAREITDKPYFQVDGQFSRDQYERVLNQQRLTPDDFEQALRLDLLAGPIESLLRGAVTVSAPEAKDAFLRERTTVDLAFVQIPVAPFFEATAEATPEAIAAWEKAAPNAERAITDYYAKHKKTRYDVPKKVCAAHILVKVTKDTPPDLRAKKEATLAQAADEISKGGDFAEIAKKYSEDANRSRGGDLGCFAAGETLAAIEEAAFGLKAGETSPVVESSFGRHLIHVREIKPAVRRKLEEVRDEIRAALTREAQAVKDAKALAEKIHQAQVTAGSLEAALASLAPEARARVDGDVQTTGPFPPGREYLPKLGPIAALSGALDALTAEAPTPPGPVANDKAWFVVRLKERKAPDESTLDKDLKQFALVAAFRKQAETRDAFIKHLRSQADVQIRPSVLDYGID